MATATLEHVTVPLRAFELEVSLAVGSTVALVGRILQDGRIRVFDREMSIAAFPVGIDVDSFVGSRPKVLREPARSVTRLIGVDRLDYTKGLPQKDCYVNVLRDAMAVDSLDKCGIYFGTTGGQVYCSPDGGDSWSPIVRDLPAVLSVEVQTLP